MTQSNGWLKSLFSDEHRKNNRRRTPPVVAYFWDGGQPVAHSVQNISPNGFYLLTKERWLLGTLIMMTLQRTTTDSSRADCSIIVMSKVIRHGDDGVGFSFIPIEAPAPGNNNIGPGSNAADRRTLDKFLHLLKADRGYALLGYLLLLLVVLVAATYGVREVALALGLIFLTYAARAGFTSWAAASYVGGPFDDAFEEHMPQSGQMRKPAQVISIDSYLAGTWRNHDKTAER
jgi:hypothetical protein